ncbi:NACHT domain-containing protein [Tumebacillus lipolyticus]|uniref:NACHT domain-containing protein n=1 Tax=Tumebacillus lipolyticus TaxID=1280370 RepID=A0ABW4ZYA7_9BACL
MAIAESGGPTTQAGITFQNAIAALYLGRMLDPRPSIASKKVVEVRVEAPEDVDDIVVTYANSRKEFIHVKESVSKSNGLDSAWGKVWRDFEQQFKQASFNIGQDRLQLVYGIFKDELELAKDLTRRATSSQNHSEWVSRLNNNLINFLDHLKTFLSAELLNDKEKLLSFFASIEVNHSPRELVEGAQMVYEMPESNHTPSALFSLLRDHVGGEAIIRGTHTNEALQDWLQDKNIIISKSVSSEELRSAIYSSSSTMRHHPNIIGRTGKHLERDTTKAITKWLLETTDQESVGVLLDQAGTGKSVLIREILEDLERQQIDVLAIKADQQLSGVRNLDELQIKLDLPVRVERIVPTLASQKPFVVLLDQLDALSLSMAHDQEGMHFALDLISRLRSISGVRIIISCRKFDFNSDPRLKNLEGCKQFSLPELSESEIQTCLEETGLNFSLLLPSTQKLLRIPLHLNLFLMAYESMENKALLQGSDFTSLQELYHLVWENVIGKQSPDSPSVGEREQALILMANYMDREQRISVPKSFFNKLDTTYFEKAVHWLSSEGILVEEGRELSFFHQTFFDYCYARDFVEQKHSLVQTLVESPQGLFQRPQLVQVLSYLRGSSDLKAYLQQLIALFTTADLRYHLKNHLHHWFASLPSPSDHEIRLADRLIKDQKMRSQLLKFTYGNPDWFEYWKSRVFPDLLDQGQEESFWEVFRYLGSIVELRQNDVIEFLRPYYGKNEVRDQAIGSLILRIEKWSCDEAVEFLELIVSKEKLDTRQSYFEWEELAHYDPKAVCRILRIFMDQALENYITKKQEVNRDPNNAYSFHFLSLVEELDRINHTTLNKALEVVIQFSALFFLDTLVPWLIHAVQTQAHQKVESAESFISDHVFSDWYEGGIVRFNDVLKEFWLRAFVKLADSQPQKFLDKIQYLSSYPFSSVQFLVARVLREVSGQYASTALKFLLNDPRRLTIGEHDDYDSRALIKSIIPHLQKSQLHELEDFIMTQTPRYKNLKLYGYYYQQMCQLRLLQAFSYTNLSDKGKRYMQQLERRFPKYQFSDNPSRIRSGTVGSPIAYDCASKMSDKQWVKAMKKYQGVVRHDDWLRGGASELSHLLQKLVQKEPQRFFALFRKSNTELDQHYVCALLNGLAESSAPADLLFEAIKLFEGNEDLNVRRTTAWAVNKRASQNVPQQIIDLLKTYLDDQLLHEHEYSNEHFSEYINTVRGASMQALMRIYSHDERFLYEKWAILCYATRSDMLFLRAGAIHELIYMISHDCQRAIDLFERAISGHPELYQVYYTAEFCYWAMDNSFKRVIPHILGLMLDEKEDVQKHGAKLVALSLISPDCFEDTEVQVKMECLLKEALSGPASYRQGVAKVFTINLLHHPSPILINGLQQLMNDDDEEVQHQIGFFLFDLKKNHPTLREEIREFIYEFAGSKSAIRNGDQLSTVLWEQSIDDPKWTLSVMNHLLNNKHIQNSTNRYHLGAKDLVRAVMNIYNDPFSDEDLQNQAMDTFDRLMELYSAQAQIVLSEWDRR